MEATLRTFIVPVIGFTAIQLHKYMNFSWLMELMFVALIVSPYMVPEKKKVDIGVQTNCDTITEIKAHTKGYNMVIGACVLLGFMGYMSTLLF
jgi:hypothetical protein